MNKTKITAIIPSAGSGTRSGLKENKIFYSLDGEPIILKTVRAFYENDKINEIIVVCKDLDRCKIEQILSCLNEKPIKFASGGETRFHSVKNALDMVDNGIVLIHDAVRPYIYKEVIDACIKTCLEHGSAIASAPLTETILETDNKQNVVASTRKNRLIAKTPQAFDVIKLKRAYSLAGDQADFTDDAGVYCSFIGMAKAVSDSNTNVKLTYPSDFTVKDEGVQLFKTALIKNSQTALENAPIITPNTVGVGFDLHRLVRGRKLILGGVEIPSEKGLLGHSDADVLTHAVMDALLSSANMRDIGYHFSDKDEKYKGISSMVLLDKVLKMLEENNVKINYISAVVMAEKPKLNPHASAIKTNLAKALKINENNISFTFTTLEGLGIIGREEGIACQCFVLCDKKQ